MSHPSHAPSVRSARLAVESLEDRTTPTFLSRPGNVIGVNNVNVQAGGLSIAAGDLLPDPQSFGRAQNEYVTGTGPGTEGLVKVWRLNGLINGQGTPTLTINPFPGFQGGVNVAVGDVLGDGALEIIAAVAGNGPPHVKVFDTTGAELGSFLAFDPAFMGGVNIAVGNVLGGIRAGGFPGGTTSTNFKQEIIVGAAAGSAPHVVVADGTGAIVRSFLAFDLGFRGGVVVAAGSLETTRSTNFSVTGADLNSYDEIIVGSATSGAHVKAFAVDTGAVVQRLSFFAFDQSTSQGVTLAAGSTDGIRGAEIYVGQVLPAAAAAGFPTVRVFNGTGQAVLDFAPFPATYTRVVNMVVANLTPAGRGFNFYDDADDNTFPYTFTNVFPNGNPDFATQDLALVAGDGALFQVPRYFDGASFFGNIPAGGNGPPP